jgi:hypothetical protein
MTTADLRQHLDTLAASGAKLPQSQLDELQTEILLDHDPRYTDLLTARLRLLK